VGQYRTTTPTPPPAAQASPSPSPATVENIAGEYKFNCNKAMFGELYGETLAPTRCADNRIYLSLQCQMYRDNVSIPEKYTLSVGHNDVQQVLVYFGRVPSFIAIETSTRFAEVACKRIGKEVLVPQSPDPKKRYIILALASAFKVDSEASQELTHLVTCISPWARINVLTAEAARKLISDAELEVNQKELCYGKKPKPEGPAQTILIYQPGGKSGGIPVTSEDVACLAEGTYLNDIIIDFYLKYIYESILSPQERQKTYIFNSYFYKRLTQKQGTKFSPEQMHGLVKKWTRNVDIFEKDFIVIPVNEHCHWYLVVVCFPGGNFISEEELSEKEEEEEEDESADFVKETKSSDEENDAAARSTNGNVAASSSDTATTNAAADSNPPTVSSSTESALSNVESNASLSSTPSDNSLPSASSLSSSSSSSSSSNTSTPSSGTDITKTAHTPSDQPLPPSAMETNATNSEPLLSTDTIKSEVATTTTSTTTTTKEKVQYKQANDADDFVRPCILIFDSLVGSGHSRVFTNLRHYLTQEWLLRKPNKPARLFDKSNMKGCYPKIPRQNNDCDCGAFLLQYVESFFTHPIKSFRIPVHLESWFTLEYVSKKRESITNLIQELAAANSEKK